MNIILDEAKKIINFDIVSFINNKGFESAIKSRINSINEKKGINGNQELLLDIFENEIIKILEKPNHTNQETQILNWTKSVYINNLSNYGPIFICSRLLRKPYYEKLFKENKTKVEEYQKNNNKTAGHLYQKFMTNQKLSEHEEMLLFRYLTANINDNFDLFSNVFKNTIKKILELNGNVSIYGKEFLMKFIGYEKCQKLGLEMPPMYITSIHIFDKTKPDFNGLHYANTVSINYALLNQDGNQPYIEFGIKNLTEWIHTITHELQHYKQNQDMEKGKFSLSAWNYIKQRILRNYLSKKDYNEYMNNYKFLEVEREANILGWQETASFLNTYSPHFQNEIKEASALSTQTLQTAKYGMKSTDNNKQSLFGIEKYNIEHLSKIIKENPQLLQQYKQLNLIFDKNGVKDLSTLIKEYTYILSNNKGKEKEVNDFYNEVFSYYFIRLDMSKINLNNLSTKEQFNMFGIISDLYKRECESLKNMMDVFKTPDKRKNWFDTINRIKLFELVGLDRIRRIKKYYSYLSKNMEYIESIKEKTPDGYKIYKIDLNLKQLGTSLASFKDRVEIYNPEFQDSEFAQVLSELPLIMDDKTFATVMMEKKEQVYGKRK